MEQNPLIDIANRIQQQRVDGEIQKLSNNIELLKKELNHMEKLIELGLLQSNGDDLTQKKVSINPKYIAYVEEDDSHAFVHMSNESILHTVESRSEILKLIEGSSSQTYIG